MNRAKRRGADGEKKEGRGVLKDSSQARKIDVQFKVMDRLAPFRRGRHKQKFSFHSMKKENS